MAIEIKGNSLPAIFHNTVKRNPQKSLFYTKREGKWCGRTYEESFEFVRKTMAGLKALDFKQGDKIIIFSENREEWILTDYACQWLGGATAAIYTTSSKDQIESICNNSEAKVVFVSNEDMLKSLTQVQKFEHLKHIVAWDKIDDRSVPSGVSFLSWNEFEKEPISEDEAEKLLEQISPDELCILLYTSGTTGEPKGVMLSHNNIVKNIPMMLNAVPSLNEKGLVALSFLPLSHIYERTLMHLMINCEMELYFAESLEKLIENIAEVRPHVMTAVPRIFEKMYSKIMDKLKTAPFLRKEMFGLAFAIGQKTFNYRYKNQPMPFLWKILNSAADGLVFKKIRAITGGRAKLFISGGAPLSKEIAEFFFQAGFRIIEGYGLSETVMLSVNRVDNFKFGTVGLPFKEQQIRIAENGEILVKGPTVMKGYYKRPDATAECIDKEGWFHTGDIGEFDEDGFLRITDRIKDLIVTSAGKNIAPQPIEGIIKKDPLVESVCLIGDRRKYIIALITPNLELCQSWGDEHGKKITCLEDCVQEPLLEAHFRDLIHSVNKTLPSYSTIKNLKVLPNTFSEATGELTPTLKLKRRVIQEKYSDVIDALYGESANPVGDKGSQPISGIL